jgi:hypothetical protein
VVWGDQNAIRQSPRLGEDERAGRGCGPWPIGARIAEGGREQAQEVLPPLIKSGSFGFTPSGRTRGLLCNL